MARPLQKSRQTVPVDRDERWHAVVARDRSRDGTFYYAVSTTGVYCRPSCAARLANPKNVSFHGTRGEAEAAGFRPCKRCKPDGPTREEERAEKVRAACRTIEAAQHGVPSLSELASSASLSPYHFPRLFKATTGVTPRAYAAALREQRMRTKLGERVTVTEAMYEAGFHASSRFYEKSYDMLGMKPRDYRAGGARVEIHFAVGECSLGSVLVAQSKKGVCAILLGDDPRVLVRDLEDRFPQAELVGGDPVYEAVVANVVGFVDAPHLGLALPLDVRGTAFQQRVWRALARVPVGSTVSYAELAKRIGAPKAVRAVAQACAANSLAVAIPCHRVLRSDSSISGYRWGVERKRALLEREAASPCDHKPKRARNDAKAT
jgi:AraC family transcriptional regulator of adaptative response/methylated-DNA-[protein]-cysteine methyltransferase